MRRIFSALSRNVKSKKITILAQEERLLTEWQGSRAGFVRDGVVSENDYKNSYPKIAFILKEVNAPDVGGRDLREICLDKQGDIKYQKSIWIFSLSVIVKKIRDCKKQAKKIDAEY